MTHRVVWLLAPGEVVQMNQIHDAVKSFWDRFHIAPSAIRMSSKDFTEYLKCSNMGGCLIIPKDQPHVYVFLTIFGSVPILLMEDDEETTVISAANSGQGSYIVVENNLVDKAFEKEVLDAKE